MKLKGSLLVAALNLALISPLSHADIRVAASSLANGDICNEIAGSWSGKGTVDVVLFKCDYRGNGTITVPSEGKLNFDVILDRTGGPDVCPKGQHLVLTGDCLNGQIKFKTTDADLEGHVSADGRSANDIHGKIYVTDAHIPANVKMNLQKN